MPYEVTQHLTCTSIYSSQQRPEPSDTYALFGRLITSENRNELQVTGRTTPPKDLVFRGGSLLSLISLLYVLLLLLWSKHNRPNERVTRRIIQSVCFAISTNWIENPNSIDFKEPTNIVSQTLSDCLNRWRQIDTNRAPQETIVGICLYPIKRYGIMEFGNQASLVN